MNEGELVSELPPRAAGLDIMLPGQFGELFRSAERTPEQRLMLAVLEDAIHCWFGAPPALLGEAYAGSKRMRLAREAERWLFDDEAWAPIGFHTCCSALGIDGEWLREKLRRIAARPHGGVTAVGFGRRRQQITLNKRFATDAATPALSFPPGTPSLTILDGEKMGERAMGEEIENHVRDPG